MSQSSATNPYYAPISFDILSGFEDDGFRLDPRHQAELAKRPSSTTAVVNGGSDTPPPGRAFWGYKPASQDLMRAMFDDFADENTNPTTGAHSVRPEQKPAENKSYQPPPGPPLQSRGYLPVSNGLLAGFSDDEDYEEENEDDLWGGDEDIYEASEHGTDDREELLIDLGEDERPTQRHSGQTGTKEPWEVVPRNSDQATILESRQRDIIGAFRQNQGSVAPVDLPGYFAPEDLRFAFPFFPAASNTIFEYY